jgi:hypothetical protein
MGVDAVVVVVLAVGAMPALVWHVAPFPHEGVAEGVAELSLVLVEVAEGLGLAVALGVAALAALAAVSGVAVLAVLLVALGVAVLLVPLVALGVVALAVGLAPHGPAEAIVPQSEQAVLPTATSASRSSTVRRSGTNRRVVAALCC